MLVESGGDNLTASFSYGLVDVQVFVIDVAGGDKVPRKGGPGVTAADLLVVNKTDLAPLVGADLDVMRRDSAAVRGGKPTLLISLREDPAGRLGGRVGARAGRGRRASAGTSVRTRGRGRRPARARAAGPCCPVVRASGQLAVRRTGPTTVHLVATAFGPLGGDDAEIRLVVEEGARADRPLGGGGGRAARPRRDPRRRAQRITADGGRGTLDLRLEPTVVAARAHHLAELSAELGRRRVLTAAEQVLLGRTGEEPGRWTGTDPDRAGRAGPLLHTTVGLGPGEAAWLPPVRPAGLCIHGAHRRRTARRGRRPGDDAVRLPAARRLGRRRRGAPSCTGSCRGWPTPRAAPALG